MRNHSASFGREFPPSEDVSGRLASGLSPDEAVRLRPLDIEAMGQVAEPVVVHLINSLYALGGAERLIVELARLSDRPPLKVVLLWNSRPSLLEDIRPGMLEVAILLPPRPSQWQRARAMIAGADILHVHLSPAQFLGAFLRKPKLFTQHNSWNRRRRVPFVRLLDRWLYAAYDRVVGVSQGVTKDARYWSDGVTQRFHTVVNGIDLARFAAPARQWSPRLRDGEVRIGMAARFSATKDHETLLRALAMLPARFSLDLVGAGRREGRLRSLAEAAGIGGRVRFHGLCEDMPAFYRSIDVYVQSSRFDGFSLVAAEAMAAGLPVLASDIDGLRDTIGNPEQCFPAGNAECLADMISSLCADAPIFERFAARGVAWSQRFSSARMAGDYRLLYAEMAGRRQA